MLRRAQAIVYAASVSTQLAAGPAVHRDKTRAQGGVFITRRYYGAKALVVDGCISLLRSKKIEQRGQIGTPADAAVF
jgi:hypothetical protein